MSAFACKTNTLTQELALWNQQWPIGLKRAPVGKGESGHEESELEGVGADIVGQILMSSEHVERRSFYGHEALPIKCHNADL